MWLWRVIAGIAMVVGALMFSTPSQAADPLLVSNLVTNGQFTNGPAGKPTGFVKDFWGTGLRPVFTYPVSGVNKGKAARVEILAPYGGEGDAKWAFGLKSVTAGKFYHYRDQFKSNGLTQVTLEYQLAGVAQLQYQLLATLDASPSKWSKVALRFRMPAGAIKAQIYHYPVGVGRLDTDNIVFGQIKPRGGYRVSITIDDGNDSFHVGQKLINAGVPATYCVIPATWNPYDAELGYMSALQTKQLMLMGHEICNHTDTHAHLTTVTLDRALSDIVTGRDRIRATIGRMPQTFAYPYGEFNQAVADLVRTTGHDAARTVDWGYNTLATNPYMLRGISIDVSTPLSEVFAELSEAKRLGQWIILIFHAINDTGEQYSNSEAYLFAVINHAKSLGMPFDTFLNAYTELK